MGFYPGSTGSGSGYNISDPQMNRHYPYSCGNPCDKSIVFRSSADSSSGQYTNQTQHLSSSDTMAKKTTSQKIAPAVKHQAVAQSKKKAVVKSKATAATGSSRKKVTVEDSDDESSSHVGDVLDADHDAVMEEAGNVEDGVDKMMETECIEILGDEEESAEEELRKRFIWSQISS
jgi:hypothetical protein